MIPQLTKEQKKHIEGISNKYAKLRKEYDDLADSLRPDKLEVPEMPEGLEGEEYDRFNDHVEELITEWNERGSDEWKAVREKSFNLVFQERRELDEYLEGIFAEHFSEIAGDVEKVVADACETADRVIEDDYKQFAVELAEGNAVCSDEIRATKDGFYLDAKAIKEEIKKAIRPNYEALAGNAEAVARIDAYIDDAIKKSDKVSARKGKRGGLVKPKVHKTTEETTLFVYPNKYTRSTTQVNNYLFGLTEKGREHQVARNFEKDVERKREVPLDKKETKFAYVSLDYSAFADDKSIRALPKLDGTDCDILDAINSLIKAGNRKIPYTAIYRMWTGKLTGNIYMSDEDFDQIDTTLDKAVGIVHVEQHEADKMGNDIGFDKEGSILMYQRGGITVNGRYVEKAIIVPDTIAGKVYRPILDEYAEYNGNELDSQDAELRRIKGLSATKENLALVGALYRRVIKMKNGFGRANKWKKEDQELKDNSRHIKFDYIYAAIGVTDPDANKRRDIKDKVEKCLKDWKKRGFIADYKPLRDKSHRIYAMDILLVPEIAQKTN